MTNSSHFHKFHLHELLTQPRAPHTCTNLYFHALPTPSRTPDNLTNSSHIHKFPLHELLTHSPNSRFMYYSHCHEPLTPFQTAHTATNSSHTPFSRTTHIVTNPSHPHELRTLSPTPHIFTKLHDHALLTLSRTPNTLMDCAHCDKLLTSPQTPFPRTPHIVTNGMCQVVVNRSSGKWGPDHRGARFFRAHFVGRKGTKKSRTPQKSPTFPQKSHIFPLKSPVLRIFGLLIGMRTF